MEFTTPVDAPASGAGITSLTSPKQAVIPPPDSPITTRHATTAPSGRSLMPVTTASMMQMTTRPVTRIGLRLPIWSDSQPLNGAPTAHPRRRSDMKNAASGRGRSNVTMRYGVPQSPPITSIGPDMVAATSEIFHTSPLRKTALSADPRSRHFWRLAAVSDAGDFRVAGWLRTNRNTRNERMKPAMPSASMLSRQP